MKTIKRVIAASVSVILAASACAVMAFADVPRYSSPGAGHYWYSYYTGCYYATMEEALADTLENGGTSDYIDYKGSIDDVMLEVLIDSNYTCSSIYQWYNSATARYYKTQTDAYAADPTGRIYNEWSSRASIDYSTSLSSTYRYYCSQTGRYYRTQSDASDDALYNYGYTNPTITDKWNSYTNIDYSSSVSSTYRYYCSQTGRYYKSQTDASNDALYNFGYSNPTITDKWNSYSNIDYRTSVSSTYRYYCSQTGRYYRTQTDASNDALYNFGYSNPTITDKWSSVSNIAYSTTLSSTYRYYCSQTGRYYKTQADASNDALYNFGYSNPTITDKWNSVGNISSSTSVSSDYRYFCLQTGRYYKNSTDASNDAIYNYNYNNPTVSDVYTDSSAEGSSTYPWYCSYTKRYYRTQSAALTAAGNKSQYVTYYVESSTSVSSTYPWFSSYTGKYYKSQADAIKDSGNLSSYVSYAYVDSSNTVSSTYPWYSSYTKKYYKSQTDAITASNNQTSYVTYAYIDSSNTVSPTYPWYSTYTGKYYKTQSDAITASNNNTGFVSFAYKVSAGTPYVNNKQQYSGWSGIASYLQGVSNGSTVTIQMNGATSVDASVLEAINGRNVKVQFVLKNGSKWLINGSTVDYADSVNINTVYNVKTVPASLIKPYTKNAISKVQISAGDEEDYGFTANISVKFGTNRSGRKAYVYHYDSSENTLKKVGTYKISNTGYCTFRTVEGGTFVIVIK